MEVLNVICSLKADGSDIERAKSLLREKFDVYRAYPDSVQYSGGSFFLLMETGGVKKLAVCREGVHFGRFKGIESACGDDRVKICDLNYENISELRKIFPFTLPVPHKGSDITIGLGDRLGLASAGHIRTIRNRNVFPVLAQQSIRELNLTDRTYKDVLEAASWAVFQEGYTDGFGADGDHLKTAEEVRMALDCGFTMITLDCSEHIDNSIPQLPQAEADHLYAQLDESERRRLEEKYEGKTFRMKSGSSVAFPSEEFKRTVLIYFKAIKHTVGIYNDIIKNCGRDIDFEMSIDETLTATSPASHFLVASELIEGGVDITSLAPRFCGEFQKGIDYIGDIERFTQEFEMHVKIADYFGYKISVHSGSDKFSVFPVIGEKTGGKYHLKTAGTNWLEAVRVIASVDPGLYRRMHKYALKRLSEARKYYHISADPFRVPEIDSMQDNELPALMNLIDSRQIIHITYGEILTALNPDGSSMFRDEIYSVLNSHENEYYNALKAHIGRHLDTLGVTGGKQ